MDKATQTIIENLHKNTGKTLDEWIEIIKKQNLKQLIQPTRCAHTKSTFPMYPKSTGK
jgi:hypothetical protein